MVAGAIVERCLLFVLLCGVLSPSLAQEAGDAVRIQGSIADELPPVDMSVFHRVSPFVNGVS